MYVTSSGAAGTERRMEEGNGGRCQGRKEQGGGVEGKKNGEEGKRDGVKESRKEG